MTETDIPQLQNVDQQSQVRYLVNQRAMDSFVSDFEVIHSNIQML